MRHTAIRISDSYAISESWRSSLTRADHVFGAAQISPDELGGYFDFSDWRGRPVSQDHFLGRWTLLYFGYSRCTGSCRAAAPVIAQAADELRSRGFAAKAAFVDIEIHPVSSPRMTAVGVDARHAHSVNWPMRFAMSQLYLDHDGKLDVLTGNRAQLAQATAAFHVLREHVPPRDRESTMSINHSSMIYLIGPDTFVAAYGYHDARASTLVSLVAQLDRAERKAIDFGAVKRRYLRGACGGEA